MTYNPCGDWNEGTHQNRDLLQKRWQPNWVSLFPPPPPPIWPQELHSLSSQGSTALFTILCLLHLRLGHRDWRFMPNWVKKSEKLPHFLSFFLFYFCCDFPTWVFDVCCEYILGCLLATSRGRRWWAQERWGEEEVHHQGRRATAVSGPIQLARPLAFQFRLGYLAQEALPREKGINWWFS